MRLVRFVLATLLAGVLLLAAFAQTTTAPPEAQVVWSIMLPNEDFLGMNTASQYLAQRQVIIVGDRVVVAYEASRAPYEEKQPMSRYRLVSLDLRTGAVKNSKEFVGGWGIGMPHIYVADDGRPMFVHRRLTSSPDDNTMAWAISPGNTPFDVHTLSPTGETLQFSDSLIPTREDDVFNLNIFWNGLNGRFAGVSQKGNRFSFEFNDSRGDFPKVIYEYFVIYDAETKQPVAIVHMKNLPKYQSWSALSPDGRYFVAGNPNALSLYSLPD